MRILFSSDVILDVLSSSTHAKHVGKLLQYCEDHIIDGFILVSDLINISNNVDVSILRQTISTLDEVLKIETIRANDIKRASRHKDFYSGLYDEFAIKESIDYVVTRDIDKYRCTIRVINPLELIELIDNGKTKE